MIFRARPEYGEEALDTVEKDIMDARPLIEKWIREDSPLYRDHDAERLLGYVNYRRAILAAHYLREGRKDLALPVMKESIESI